jgi:hypothetical protein
MHVLRMRGSSCRRSNGCGIHVGGPSGQHLGYVTDEAANELSRNCGVDYFLS